MYQKPQLIPGCGDKTLCEINHLYSALEYAESPLCGVHLYGTESQYKLAFTPYDFAIILFLSSLLGAILGGMLIQYRIEHNSDRFKHHRIGAALSTGADGFHELKSLSTSGTTSGEGDEEYW